MKSRKKTYLPFSRRYLIKYRGTKCLNCEIPLEKSDCYCPNCGQLNSTKKISIIDMIEELFTKAFSYDSKLRKTLTSLILRPGKVTAEYVQGKRMIYSSPFRFFLSITFLYFLMIGYSSDFSNMDKFADLEMARDSLNMEMALKKLRNKTNDPKEKATIDSLIIKFHPKTGGYIDQEPNAFFNEQESKPMADRLFNKTDYFFNGIRTNQYKSYEEAIAKLRLHGSFENKVAFSIAINSYKTAHHPGNFYEGLITRLPFVIFFYLPIFSIFIWLVYPKNKFYYIDHLIFSFHTQTIFTLLLIVVFLVKWAFNYSIHGFAVILFLIYLYKSMRGFYKEEIWKTIVKFLYLNTIFLILASLSILVVILASITVF